MKPKPPASKPKKRGRPRSGKYIVPALKTPSVMRGLEALFTRTYGRPRQSDLPLRTRAPHQNDPDES